MTTLSKSDDTSKIWRYMSFGRFVWMLHSKQLWLPRIDMLGDSWELSLSGEQLAHVVSRYPLTPIDEPRTGPRETAIERSRRIIHAWRRCTFVSCWTAAEHESHALWRIHCRSSSEGVAVQTTLSRLRDSVEPLPIHRVMYREAGSLRQTPGLIQLATEKRPMFAYEKEIRIVYRTRESLDDRDDESRQKPGVGIDWSPEDVLKGVFVHPDADASFMEAVAGVVGRYAPTLESKVAWSAMQARPPF